MKALDKDGAKLKLIGLGESSIRKNYYGELLNKTKELEEKTRELEEKNRRLEEEITQREEAEVALRTLNDALEERIQERTRDLDLANQELVQSFETLKLTQNYILQSEKMEAIGILMAGLAHELNTPLGNGLMGISYQMALLKNFSEQATGSFPKLSNQMVELIEDLNEATEVVSRNLNLCAQMVSDFKTIVEDQSQKESKYFDVNRYSHMVINAQGREIRRLGVKMTVDTGNLPLYMEGRPGILSQILTPLLDNALNHAFEGVENPEIIIRFQKQANIMSLVFIDNGKGIPEEMVHKIFEPFFSTKKGKSHRGMGLFTVYEIVTKQLKGEIVARLGEQQGMEVIITFPHEK